MFVSSIVIEHWEPDISEYWPMEVNNKHIVQEVGGSSYRRFPEVVKILPVVTLIGGRFGTVSFAERETTMSIAG